MNYKSIGEIIEIQKCKNNIGLTDENLLGININKKFVPSVANTIGTDITAYKVVKKGRFACNRMHVGRDKVLPISLSDREEPFIVSPAYDVFAITDKDILPEYLMMWLSREQFDKEARFYTDGDVRGGLPWDSFCNMKLPIPSLDEQQRLIKEYNVVQKKIDINNAILQKIEDVSQTLYKQRFIDYEFPNEDGLPYKSNGGEMLYCKDLEKDIPVGWEYGCFLDYADRITNSQPPKSEFLYHKEEGYIRFIQNRDYSSDKNITYIKYSKNLTVCSKTDILIDKYGDAGALRFGLEGVFNVALALIKPKNIEYKEYIRQFLSTYDIYKYLHESSIASTRASLNEDNFLTLNIIIPPLELAKKYNVMASQLINSILNYREENKNLIKLKDVFLSQMGNNV